ncbi:MAG TPA: hypothetical protein VGQ12_00990 [Candidatus Angelobacter sp.]|jgi:hypothetical protein|nr:hypothetical protein [Candidatus Angelobacter sp.]
MKVHSSHTARSIILLLLAVPVVTLQAQMNVGVGISQQSTGPTGTATASTAQNSATAGQVAATATPALVAAPAQMPGIVETAARMTAQTIVDRKKKKADPEGYFGVASTKIAIFAVAAAVDPTQAKAVPYAAPYIAAVETHRTDKQVGASAASSGSTSAADKPGIPYLLGLALEHGAIAQNISGSTLTLTTSPYALVTTIAEHQDTAETYNKYRGLTRLAVSASYNLQDTNDPLASVRRQQLAEWAVKLRLFGDHSARSEEAHQLFVDTVLPALEAKANTMAKALNQVFPDEWPRLVSNFSRDTDIRIRAYLKNSNDNDAAAEDKITQIIVDGVKDYLYPKIDTIGLTPDQRRSASEFLMRFKSDTNEYVRSAEALDTALKALDKKATLTLGYFNERGSSGTPNYSVGKLMFEKKPEGFMQIDANLSASAYGNPDRTKNQQTFRDATAALQFQQNLGRSPFLSNPDDKNPISLAFAGRYERLQENRHVPGKKADIAVANWKIEIPVAPGVSLPISITYANATELIKEQDVRGNFGITFDLDKLRALATAR